MRLLNALAFLAADVFALVANTFSFVGLRRMIRTDIRGDLADELLIDTLNRDFGVVRYLNRNAVRDWVVNGMRFPQTQIEYVTFNRSPKTDALDFEASRETFTYTFNHIRDQTARKAVGRFDRPGITCAGKSDPAIFLFFRGNSIRQAPGKLPFGTFDHNRAIVTDGDVHFIRKRDRLITDSRHGEIFCF